jgi:WD40 repeat protein
VSYDAFISYSHAADDQLAPKLQGALQRFAKPWYRRRGLNCFRDKTGLSANPGLWSSITTALEDSEHFVLLASEGSASSEWVNNEIEFWRTHKPMAKLLPVVTDGEWVWDREANDFDWARSTAVPAALAGAFTEEPRHIDMRWARDEEHLDLRHSRFRDQVAELAAPMFGKTKDELEGDDVRQHRKTLRLAWGAAVALLVLTIAAVLGAGVAVSYASTARKNLHEANTQKALALRNQRIAKEQEDLAKANERLANRQRRRAETQTEAAQRNAAEAKRQQGRAQDALGQAQTQRRIAEANAREATANAARADRNAAEANRQLFRARVAEQRQKMAAEDALRAAAAERTARIAADKARQEADAQRAIAEAQTRVAVSEALASQALQRSDTDLDLSLLLATESARSTSGGAAAPSARATARAGAELPVLSAARNSLLSTVSQAGDVKHFLSFDGTEPTAFAGSAASPDGRYYAAAELTDFTGTLGGSSETRVHVWDTRSTSTAARVLVGPGDDLTVVRLEFGHNGRILFSLELNEGTLLTRVWDVATGKLLDSEPTFFAMSPDRRTAILHFGDVMRVVDAGTGATVAERQGSLAWSNGALLADLSPEGRFFRGARNFSPDGRYAVGLSSAGTPVVWDLRDGAREIALLGLSQPVLPSGFPVFDADGTLAAAAVGPVIGVFDPSTGGLLGTLSSPTGFPIVSLAIHGTEIAGRDAGGHVFVIDMATGETTLNLPLGLPLLGEVSYSPAGRFLVLTSETAAGSEVQLVDVATGQTRVTTPATEVVFSSDESVLFAIDYRSESEDHSVTEDFKLRQFDTATGALIDVERTNGLALQSAQFAAAPGRYLAVLVPDDHGVNRPKLWNLASPRTAPAVAPGAGYGITNLSFDATGDNLAGTGFSGAALVWDAPAVDPLAQRLGEVFDQTDAARLAVSRDGVTSAVSRDGRTIAFRHMLLKAERPGPTVDAGTMISSMTFTPDGAHLVVNLDSGTSTIYRLSDGARTARLPGWVAAASGDGRVVLVQTGQHEVSRYRVADGARLGSTDTSALPTNTVDFADAYALDHTGSQIAGTNKGPLAVVWDATGAVTHRFATDDGLLDIYAIAFSPDGHTLAVRSADLDLRLFSLDFDALIRDEPIGFSRANGGDMAYSPDGSLIAIDGLIVVDAATLQQVGPRLYETNAFEHFFTADGRYLMATPIDRPGVVLRWNVDPGDLAAQACGLVGRNMTRAEWTIFMPPDQAYRKTCDQYALER